MTYKKLSSLYAMTLLVERDKKRLKRLRRSANYIAIAKQEAQLNAHVKKRARLDKEIKEYIIGIEDRQMRVLVALRFVELLTWRQVAQRTGGGNTEDGVKKAVYRFIKKEKDG